MGRDGLRRWLSTELRRPDVPDALWDALEEEGVVDDVLSVQDRGTEAFDEERSRLVTVARRFLAIGRDLHGETSPGQGNLTPGPVRHPFGSIDLPPEEKRYAAALSMAIAFEASQVGEVIMFRTDRLNGEFIHPDQIDGFFDSPALRLIPLDMVDALELPLTQFRWDVHEAKRREKNRWVDVDFTAPSGTPYQKWSQGYWHRITGWADRVILSAGPSVSEVVVDRTEDTSTIGFQYIGRLPEQRDFKRRMSIPAVAWSDSAAGELTRLAEFLSKSFAWTPAQATTFVVTGEVPLIKPISGGTRRWLPDFGSYATIQIEVAPWLSKDTVQRAYRVMQDLSFRRSNRMPGERSVQLVTFVASRRMEAVSRQQAPPTWEELRRAWNRAFPHWREHEYRNLSKDFHRTVKNLKGQTTWSDEQLLGFENAPWGIVEMMGELFPDLVPDEWIASANDLQTCDDPHVNE